MRSIRLWSTLLAGSSIVLSAQAPATVPRIWSDAALADWATPVAALNLRPSHYSEAEYYQVPGDNLRTYPIYHPDAEPPGYWEELQKKKPERLVDISTIRTRDDWIKAGERAFGEVDSFWSRTNDPAVIAQARNPLSFHHELPSSPKLSFKASEIDPAWPVIKLLSIFGLARLQGTH